MPRPREGREVRPFVRVAGQAVHGKACRERSHWTLAYSRTGRHARRRVLARDPDRAAPRARMYRRGAADRREFSRAFPSSSACVCRRSTWTSSRLRVTRYVFERRSARKGSDDVRLIGVSMWRHFAVEPPHRRNVCFREPPQWSGPVVVGAKRPNANPSSFAQSGPTECGI